MDDPRMSMPMRDPGEVTAGTERPAGGDVAVRLRELVGTEAWGRLLEASKITGRPALQVLREAADAYATLAGHERSGFAIQLVRDTEVRPFRLE